MAKVTVCGEAVVIASSLKLDEIRLIEKYRKSDLTLLGGENGKEPLFTICTTNGAGSINQFGVAFNGETHDDEHLACLTMVTKGVTGDVKEWVADQIGGAIMKLNQLEAKLPDVLASIAADKETILSNISVMA